MIDRVLIDSLNLRARDFAVKWKEQIRSAPHLKHYQSLDDEELIEKGKCCFPLLSQILDRGLNNALIGDFFVTLGKERMKGGFPVSEVIYGLNLEQKVVIEYMMTEFAPDNPMRMYQSMGAITKISEFFLLGSFYVIKGFLEETYKSMNRHDKVSEEMLKKYFKDDFFFK
ncbi:MAG: hypothetical protein LBI12_06390 [Treponema sp.]|jgi:hypothetical protein|nr:hypothetical protein [Treponema sp.]